MNSIDRIDYVTGLCSLYDLRFVSPSLLCEGREPNVPLHKKMFWYGGGGGGWGMRGQACKQHAPKENI